MTQTGQKLKTFACMFQAKGRLNRLGRVRERHKTLFKLMQVQPEARQETEGGRREVSRERKRQEESRGDREG